jgi:hypothetical protein
MILLYEGDTMSLISSTKENCQHTPLGNIAVGKVLICSKCGCQLNFYNPPAGTHKRMSKKERRKMSAAKFRAAMKTQPVTDREVYSKLSSEVTNIQDLLKEEDIAGISDYVKHIVFEGDLPGEGTNVGEGLLSHTTPNENTTDGNN